MIKTVRGPTDWLINTITKPHHYLASGGGTFFAVRGRMKRSIYRVIDMIINRFDY